MDLIGCFFICSLMAVVVDAQPECNANLGVGELLEAFKTCPNYAVIGHDKDLVPDCNHTEDSTTIPVLPQILFKKAVDCFYICNCQDPVDQCLSSPCVRGNCTDGYETFTCECPIGYKGPLCDQEIPKCDCKPCLNGGTCTDVLPSDLTCACTPAYTGIYCQEQIITVDPGVTFNCSLDDLIAVETNRELTLHQLGNDSDVYQLACDAYGDGVMTTSHLKYPFGASD